MLVKCNLRNLNSYSTLKIANPRYKCMNNVIIVLYFCTIISIPSLLSTAVTESAREGISYRTLSPIFLREF